jgi:hypothetical protein
MGSKRPRASGHGASHSPPKGREPLAPEDLYGLGPFNRERWLQESLPEEEEGCQDTPRSSVCDAELMD